MWSMRSSVKGVRFTVSVDRCACVLGSGGAMSGHGMEIAVSLLLALGQRGVMGHVFSLLSIRGMDRMLAIDDDGCLTDD